MAMRDCYAAMGPLPQGTPPDRGADPLQGPAQHPRRVDPCESPHLVREEAGAAGAAMMAAVAIGAYPDMNTCIAEWVTPLLGAPEDPDPQLAATYDRLFPPSLPRAVPRPRLGRPGQSPRGRDALWRQVMTDNDMVDLFVIGGGINGAGVARDAAGRGLKVVLCEKDDLAEGTSSRSGKLVHGGLRYLDAEFRLVREALMSGKSC